MIVAPLTSTVLADAGERDAGIACGVNNAVARVAGLLGIAVVGAAIAGADNQLDLPGYRMAMAITAALVAAAAIIGLAGIRNSAMNSARGGDRVRPRDEALSRPRRGGARRPVARDPGRHVLRARRPVGRRQDDRAEDGQPPDPVRRGRHPHRRPQHPRAARRRAAARDRLRDPAGRALPAHDGRREHRDRAAAARLAEGSGSASGAAELLELVGLEQATRSATRRSSPAGSASASGSRARSRPTRRCC